MNRQSQYKKSGLSTYSLRNKREEKRNDTKQQRNDLIMRRRGKMPLAEIQEDKLVTLDKTSTYKIRVFYLNYTIILSTPQGLVSSLIVGKQNWNSGSRRERKRNKMNRRKERKKGLRFLSVQSLINPNLLLKRW